mgnify:CR=1 FL=1
MVALYKLQTRAELAAALDIPLKKLTYLLYIKGTENCYSAFWIPKKSGGVRVICAPNEDLKEIQKKLASLLQDKQFEMHKDSKTPRVLSHGFERGRNIFSNSKIHCKKRFVFNLDLEDFFGSIHFGRIVGYFEKNRFFEFSHEVAVAIAQLCCYQGKLPQGAPTSPVLANLVSEILDYKLLNISKKYRVDYTRYADDLTFSTNDPKFLNNYESFYREVNGTIRRAGFAVNEKKTRLQYRDSRQTVTGLVVNQKINIYRDYYKQTRAMAHQLYKTGSFQINGVDGTLAQLEGRFAFIHQCDLLNSNHITERKPTHFLTSREKQYQKFLFYKTFYAHDTPLLVMEGPTDIRYLKAALMNMHNDYPKLVQRESDGSFKFRIRFFQRTPRQKHSPNASDNTKKISRWRYLFDVVEGADSMSNIYEFYTGTQGRPPYFKEFAALSNLRPIRPVILIFDNELDNSDKPIYKFLKGIKDRERIKKEIQNSTYSHLLKDSNLHLVTHPLPTGEKEGEIESLFDESTRQIKLGGKSFNPNEKTFDKAQHYGKDIFSKYIISNYESINFNGFRPMLDLINRIITESEQETPDAPTP